MNEVKSRRRFIKQVGVVTAAASLAHLGGREVSAQAAEKSGEIPRRLFGRTGVQVSILGVGGHTIGQAKTEAEGIRINYLRAVEG